MTATLTPDTALGVPFVSHSATAAIACPGAAALPSQATDTSRLLLGMLRLACRSEPEGPEDIALEGVVRSHTLRSLLSGLHVRDLATVQHSRRVAQLATGLSQFLGWEKRHLKLIEIAGLLHDVGKIGVPDTILNKPGVLGPDESALMSLHHNICVDILQAAGVDHEIIEIVGQSREKFGSTLTTYRRPGVPMHMGARILAVADAYDAIRCNWVYRHAKTHEETLHILRENSGSQFDGNIVAALQRWTKESGDPLGARIETDLAQATGALGTPNQEDSRDSAFLVQVCNYLYMLESLYDGFYIVDSDMHVRVWNGGAERLLGHPATDMIDRVWTGRVLAYADHMDKPLKDSDTPIAQALATGRAATHETKIQHADGRWLRVEAYTVPLVDEEGRVLGVAEIHRDLGRTSRRPLENHQLHLAATRDALTGVCNRGELETQLALLLSDCSKTNFHEPFSVIFADVDHFKSINDTFGHTTGDKVLIEFAKLLQHETYSAEIVGRYGGEEFVILCPSTDIAQAVKRADRVRLSIGRMEVEGLHARRVTSSFGVTQVEPGDSLESVLRRADEALYEAKRTGRNKVCSRTRSESDNHAKQKSPELKTARYCHEGVFHAIITSDMVVYKLGGFVCDENGKLLEVTPNRALIRVGRCGLFRWWGSSEEKQPVDIELQFADKQIVRDVNGRKVRSSQVEITARVRPYGHVSSKEVFETRAKKVLKRLSSYFVAETGSNQG